MPKLEGLTVRKGPSLLAMMRAELDKATRHYLKLKAEGWGPTDVKMSAARHGVRGRAVMVAMIEDVYHWQDQVSTVERWSVERVGGKVRRHDGCGRLMLVNGMCARGHDPSGH